MNDVISTNKELANSALSLPLVTAAPPSQLGASTQLGGNFQ